MLTREQKRELNNVLLEYWEDASATDVVDIVLQIAGPAETAEFFEKEAARLESTARHEVVKADDEYPQYLKREAEKYRRLVRVLRTKT